MPEAVIGLLSALGGAVIAAAAAYWGPLQVQRRQAAAAQKEVDAANAAARSARALAQRDEEIARIILMRTTTRSWYNLLEHTLQNLTLGLTVSIDRFNENVIAAEDAAQSALDQALHSGLWVRGTTYGYPLDHSGWEHTGPRSHEQVQVLTALRAATDLMREAVIQGGPDPQSSWALQNALHTASIARKALSIALLNQLEQVITVTVIGPSLTDPGERTTPRDEDAGPASLSDTDPDT